MLDFVTPHDHTRKLKAMPSCKTKVAVTLVYVCYHYVCATVILCVSVCVYLCCGN
jgi:hypothetical protein